MYYIDLLKLNKDMGLVMCHIKVALSAVLLQGTWYQQPY